MEPLPQGGFHGARHGPLEDVGGPRSYDEFLKAIADPAHEQHAELSEWSGGDFDPDRLDAAMINAALAAKGESHTTLEVKASRQNRLS